MDKFVNRNQDKKERSLSVGRAEEKRKREETDQTEEDEQLAFKRSLKVPRSPRQREREGRDMEEVLKRLEVLKDIQSELKEIKQTNQELKKNNEELKNEVRNYQKTLEEENRALKERLAVMEKKVAEIEDKQEKNEKQERRNNLVISCKTSNNPLDKKPEKVKEKAQEILKKVTEQDVSFEKATLITTSKSGRDIIAVKMNSFDEKLNIMRNKGKLRGSDIFIDSDLTKREAEVQKKIRDKVQEEKNKGNNAKVGYKKIWINGVWRPWNQE